MMLAENKQSLVVMIPILLLLIGFVAIPFSPSLNALIMVVGLWSIINSKLRLKLKPMLEQPAFWWGLGFFIWILMRSIGGYPETASVKFKFFLHYFNLFLPIFLLPPLFKAQKNRIAMMAAVIISACVMGIILFLGVHAPKISRIHTYVLHIETLQISVFLAIAAYCALVLCRNACDKKYQIVLSLIAFLWITMALLVFQHERIGLLLYVIGLTAFLFQNLSFKKAASLFVLAIVGIILVLSLYQTSLEKRIAGGISEITHYQIDKQSQLRLDKSSIGVRLYFYGIGYQQWKQDPMIGYGAGTYSHYQGDNHSADFVLHMSGHNGTAENHFLTIALQLGLIGLILFLGYMFYLWRLAGQVPTFERNIIRMLIIFLLVSGVFFPAFTFNIVTITFSGLLGVSFGALGVQHDDTFEK